MKGAHEAFIIHRQNSLRGGTTPVVFHRESRTKCPTGAFSRGVPVMSTVRGDMNGCCQLKVNSDGRHKAH